MLKRVENANVTGFAIVKRQLDERTVVVAVEGELDLSTAPRLKWMLVDSLESGSRLIVLDLSQCTFMDSTALGVLVAVNRRPDIEAPLAIVCPGEKVRQIFEFSGTDSAFTLQPTLEEALERVRRQTAEAG